MHESILRRSRELYNATHWIISSEILFALGLMATFPALLLHRLRQESGNIEANDRSSCQRFLCGRRCALSGLFAPSSSFFALSLSSFCTLRTTALFRNNSLIW